MSVTHCSFPLLLICYSLQSFCVAMLEELGQNGNDILLQIVGCSTIKYFAEFVGFVISPHVPCCCLPFLLSVCIPCEEASTSTTYSASPFQQATVALSHKKVSSHGTCKLQRHTCTLCGSLLLFKTERVLSAIQQTCFCQLCVISTNY